MLNRQRGELSLMWAAVLIGVVTLVAMVGLMSARHERNYFGEAWKRITMTEAGQVLQQTQQSAERAARAESADIRKCVIDGKVVYSNVECNDSASRKVQLQDTRGFEAPKLPPASAPEAEGKDMRQKMIDKAVER